MNTITALIFAIVGAVNDVLPSCEPVEALVEQMNESVDGYGEGVLFVYPDDCSIGYQD